MKKNEVRVTNKRSILFAAVLSCFILFFLNMEVSAAPPKVTGVKQTSASNYSIKVEWDMLSVNNIRYKLEYSTDGVNWADNYAGSQPYDTITSLNSGKVLYARVKAFLYGMEQDCSYSDTIKVITKPGASSELKQINATNNTVIIGWKAGAGATGYNIYLSSSYISSTDNLSPVATVQGGNTTSYTLSNLRVGTQYYVKVCPIKLITNANGSFTAIGDGSYSESVVTLPQKVSGVANSRYNNNSLWVDYDRNTIADGYQVVVYNAAGKKIKTFENSKYASYIWYNNAPKNSWVNVKVRGYVNINGSPKYGEWSNNTICVSQPSIGKATKRTGKIQVNWPKVKNATGYDIYVSYSQKNGYRKVKSVKAKTTSLSLNKFKNKTISRKKSYYVYVVAKVKVKGKTYRSIPYYTTRVW